MSRLPIVDYALLSDCRSAALVGRDGSIDWLCFPRFDGASVFGRLLDDAAGFWSIRPAGAAHYETSRQYVDDTMVLETTFTTAEGSVTVTDALAVGRNERGHDLGAGAVGALLRRVSGVEGSVDLELVYAPRPEYGLVSPLLQLVEGGITARGGADVLALSSSVRVSQIPHDQPAGLGVQDSVEARTQTGEHEIEMALHLVRQRDLRGDLAATVRRPRHLRRHRVVTNLWQATRTPHQQLSHRAQVTLVALQPAPQLLGPCFLHRCRVQLDHLDTTSPQPSHQRPVIVPSGLDTDPAHHRVACGHGRADRGQQLPNARLVELELERCHEHLAVMVSDQRHRRPLPHIDRHHKTSLRIDTADTPHEPALQITTNKSHQPPPVKTSLHVRSPPPTRGGPSEAVYQLSVAQVSPTRAGCFRVGRKMGTESGVTRSAAKIRAAVTEAPAYPNGLNHTAAPAGSSTAVRHLVVTRAVRHGASRAVQHSDGLRRVQRLTAKEEPEADERNPRYDYGEDSKDHPEIVRRGYGSAGSSRVIATAVV